MAGMSAPLINTSKCLLLVPKLTRWAWRLWASKLGLLPLDDTTTAAGNCTLGLPPAVGITRPLSGEENEAGRGSWVAAALWRQRGCSGTCRGCPCAITKLNGNNGSQPRWDHWAHRELTPMRHRALTSGTEGVHEGWRLCKTPLRPQGHLETRTLQPLHRLPSPREASPSSLRFSLRDLSLVAGSLSHAVFRGWNPPVALCPVRTTKTAQVVVMAVRSLHLFIFWRD